MDLLSDILNQIDQHNQRYTGHSIIVYLGDYIDRRACSKQVIDLVLNYQRNQQFEKIIVHGHTKTESVALLPNRIGIDTGAYESNVLTCLVLQTNQYKLIQICSEF